MTRDDLLGLLSTELGQICGEALESVTPPVVATEVAACSALETVARSAAVAAVQTWVLLRLASEIARKGAA